MDNKSINKDVLMFLTKVRLQFLVDPAEVYSVFIYHIRV